MKKEWVPTYLPVEPYPPWRLVDENGTFKKDKKGSITFETREEAVEHDKEI